MIFRYLSGEKIQEGDRVRLHGMLAVVELVPSDHLLNPAFGYMSNATEEVTLPKEEFDGGVLIFDPFASRRMFIPKNSFNEIEDLEFVSRVQT